MFRYNGKYYTIYNRYDSYHNGKGVDIVKEIDSFMIPPTGTLADLLVSRRTHTTELVKLLKQLIDMAEVSDGELVRPDSDEEKKKEWDDILSKIPDGPIKDSWLSEEHNFSSGQESPPVCGPFIEYIYIVDLDDSLFYASDHYSTRYTYWPLSSIPENWIKQIRDGDGRVSYGPAPLSVYRNIEKIGEDAGYKIETALECSEEAVVYQVKNNETEEVLVAKIFFGDNHKVYHLGKILSGKNSIRVAQALLECPHPNVVEIKQISKWGPYDVILMSKYDIDFRQFDGTDVVEITTIAAHAARGIDHLHMLGFVHNDVNLTKILGRRDSEKLNFAIGDFEKALQIPKDMQDIKVKEMSSFLCTHEIRTTLSTDSSVFEVDYHLLAKSLENLRINSCLLTVIAGSLTDVKVACKDRARNIQVSVKAFLLEQADAIIVDHQENDNDLDRQKVVKKAKTF